MMEIFQVDQNSEEWLEARLGLVTASTFSAVLAKGRGGAESKTRASLMHRLAGEIITGKPGENFSTPAMERGHEMESEARNAYAFMKDAEPELVGFIRNGRAGCSPDALIGDDGLLEIKTKKPERLIECMFRDEIPAEHKAQCQGQIWVAERNWVDLVAYWPGMPLAIWREYRDEEYIKTLSDAVDRFNADLDELVNRIRSYGVAA